jgi:hypothetical protein
MPKDVEGHYEIRANYKSCDMEKFRCESVGSERLVGRQCANYVPDFLFRESSSEAVWVELRLVEYIEVYGVAPRGGSAKHFVKDVKGNCHHAVLVGRQLVLMLQREEMILMPPRVGVSAEEAGRHISFC